MCFKEGKNRGQNFSEVFLKHGNSSSMYGMLIRFAPKSNIWAKSEQKLGNLRISIGKSVTIWLVWIKIANIQMLWKAANSVPSFFNTLFPALNSFALPKTLGIKVTSGKWNLSEDLDVWSCLHDYVANEVSGFRPCAADTWFFTWVWLLA